MKKFILFTFAVFLSLSAFSSAFARPVTEEEAAQKPERKKFQIGISFSNSTASSYFDYNDKRVSELPDSSLYVITKTIKTDYVGNFTTDTTLDTSVSKFTTDYRKSTWSVFGSYSPMENFEIRAEIPFSFYSLDESYLYYTNYELIDKVPGRVFDMSSSRIHKGEVSLFRVDHLQLGASYDLQREKSIFGLDADVKIPLGIDNASGDSAKSFLQDNPFEMIAGTHFGFDFKKAEILGYLKYRYIDNQPNDMFIIGTNFSLKTVENTRLSFMAEFGRLMGEFDKSKVFSTRATPLQENYADVGCGFRIDFSQSLFAEFSYKLRLGGTNTWGIGGVYIKSGYRL